MQNGVKSCRLSYFDTSSISVLFTSDELPIRRQLNKPNWNDKELWKLGELPV